MKNGIETEDLGDACHWYALYTRHQHEKTIAGILSNKGHEVFLPLYGAAHRWKDRTKQLWLPLFPCYVFIKGGLDHLLDIVSTPGVYTIVSWASRPAIIPQVEIEAVRALIANCSRVEPHPFLKCGDRVRVTCGPLQGLEGILVRKKNLFRLVISLEMLGRSAAVDIDTSRLERLDSAHVYKLRDLSAAQFQA
jgi:transcription antitermination factor NusG